MAPSGRRIRTIGKRLGMDKESTARFNLRQSEHFSLPFVPKRLFPPFDLIMRKAFRIGVNFFVGVTDDSRRCWGLRGGRKGLLLSIGNR